jgi:nucleotide-binding universal stress UspA family protein
MPATSGHGKVVARLLNAMIEIRRILCPIDFSDFSRHALDHAMAIARWYGATITLLHVHAILPPPIYALGTDVLPAAGFIPVDREALVASMKRFAGSQVESSAPLEFDIAEGVNTALEILNKAMAMPADLLVLGTHGRSGFERLVLGSVTEKVLRKATCPVLSVPKNVPELVSAPPVLFKRILCAVDFSNCSTHALNVAMSLAQEAEAHLDVVHVLELPPEIPPGVHETVLAGPRSLQEYIALAEEDRRARLEEAVPQDVRAYCVVETMLATGKPYQEILRIAAERKSDLIVIGIHGRGAADLLFFGSTAQHVVRQASCPVLTLRTE